ncbi:MAG: hypothetical protein C0418_05915 [Coriobacteriaceae bacterium]|nr:hypothetical protein [Coriobacteriaceae bacterium]
MTAYLRRFATLATVPLAVVFALAAAPAEALACTCPTRYDYQCIDFARTAVGSWYVWGGSQWSTTDRNWKGADCSGLLCKGWQVAVASRADSAYHPYSTTNLFNNTYHWYSVSRGSAWKGDAVGYPPAGTESGHVVMYYYGSPYGQAYVIEAPRAGYRIRQGYKDISASKWQFRRRHNLTLTAGPA